jgi:hypothetical protein
MTPQPNLLPGAGRDRKTKLKEWRHDPVVVLLGNGLAASDSVINDGVVFLQQTLGLTEVFSTELPET